MAVTLRSRQLIERAHVRDDVFAAIRQLGLRVLIPVRRVLASCGRASAHIFNLGHGVPPQTDPDQLARLTEFVHNWQG